VVVGQRERQHQAGSNSRPFHTGFVAERVAPRIATSGALMIGVNPVPPMPPSERW
jgi:hypothetical protein